MFRHAQAPNQSVDKIEEKKVESAPADNISASEKNKSTSAVNSETSLKELIEKNLKWSQIIYEQNRKINGKLMWMAIASWLKLFIILVPLILAILFLPPIVKDVWSRYGELLGMSAPKTGQTANSFDSVINLLNLDPAKQEQLKALLK